MKALVADGSGGVEVVELPPPVPAPDQVLVAVHSCGICGSDVHAVRDGWAAKGHVLGHELSGTVTARGSAVRSLSEGDRVAVNPLGGCGDCPACRRGMPFACAALPNIGLSAQGGFAELIPVRAAQLRRLPEAMATEDGAHVEPLAVALNALDLAGVAAGDDAFVLGVGPVGLNVILALRALGAGRIVAVGRSPGRRQAAAGLGADLVLDARDPGYDDALADLAGSMAHSFECSGAAEAVASCARVTGIGGTVVQLALPGAPVPLDLMDFVSRGLRLAGSCAFGVDTFDRSLELVAASPAAVAQLVSERVALDDAPDAFARLAHPGNLVGILVQPATIGG